MRPAGPIVLFATLAGLLPVSAAAQPYAITWSTVDGGGHGPISGGAYSLQGTIGQPDASGSITGGTYSVSGGYWVGSVGALAPSVAPALSSNVLSTSADLSSDVTSDGGSPITARGFVYSIQATNSDPLIGGTGVTDAGVAGTTGAFGASASILLPSTTYAFKAYAINDVGTTYTATAMFTTTASGCPAITLGALNNGTLGVVYAGSVVASGGTGPYSYAVTSPSLPPGLSLTLSDPGAGAVTGTPTVVGSYSFEITATDSNLCTGVGTYNVVVGSPIAAGDLLISEFRFHGAGDGTFDGTLNEYVEIHNRTANPVLVGGGGVTLAKEDGTVIGTIPAGQEIAARGFYLFANRTDSGGSGPSGFSLSSLSGFPAGSTTVGEGDAGLLIGDIPDGAGIGLFRGTTLSDATRIDSVGFSGVEPLATMPLYREGAGLTPGTGITMDGEYAFARKSLSGPGGVLQDTGNNANDFLFVAPDAGTYSGVLAALGGPSPQTSESARERTDAQVKMSLVWPPTGGNGLYNRALIPIAGDPAAFEFRRRFTNLTGQPLTDLRFRVSGLTTKNSPVLYASQSDLRPVESPLATQELPGPSTSNALGLELDHESMYETFGTTKKVGGLNSVLRLTAGLPGGILAPNDSVDVNFKVFLYKGGSFAYWVVPLSKP